MPHYFFHVEGEERDAMGHEFVDLATAKYAAVQTAGAILCDESKQFLGQNQWSMTVTDRNDLTLFEVTFYASEAAAIPVHQ